MREIVTFWDDEIGVFFDKESKRLFESSPDTAHAYSNGKIVLPEEIEVELNKPASNRLVPKNAKRLQLIMTTKCNLNCRYCYAQGGNYGLKEEIISRAVLDAAADYVIKEGIGKVVFFGGEPLLAHKEIEYFIERTHNTKGIKYAMVTNLTIINQDIIRLLKENNITLTVSLDGPEEINDRNRYYKDGRPTHRVITGNIKKLEEYGISVAQIECTYGKEHVSRGYTKESMKDYFNIEFPGIKAEIFDETGEDEVCTYEECINPSDYVRFWFGERESNFCGAGKTSVTLCPDGTMYPCQVFVGKEEYEIGNILESFEIKKDVIEKMEYLKRRVNCGSCNAKIGCAICYWDLLSRTEQDLKKMCQCIKNSNEKSLLKFVKERH